MKKINILIILFYLLCQGAMAQGLEELKAINAKSKSQFVTPEALDQLMIDIRQYEKSPVAGQDTILLGTYQAIIAAYMANNHFKQAYEVIIRYLDYKENMLVNDKQSSISHALSSNGEKKQQDDIEQATLQEKYQKLKNETDSAESKRLSFKRNFSFGLIILSSIFAIMLVGAGIRMMSLRSKTRQVRDRMKNIHRISVMGNFDIGLKNSMLNSLSSIESKTSDVRKELKNLDQNFTPVKQANQIISGIEKLFKEMPED